MIKKNIEVAAPKLEGRFMVGTRSQDGRFHRRLKTSLSSAEEEFMFGEEAGESIDTRKQILEERHKFVQDFFNDRIPGLVPDAFFSIQKNNEGLKEIVMDQEFVDIACDFASDNFLAVLEDAVEEGNEDSVFKQFGEIYKAFKDMVARYPDKVIDLFGKNNLVLTNKGEWKILDTNILLDSRTAHGRLAIAGIERKFKTTNDTIEVAA